MDQATAGASGSGAPPLRGAPLVATPARWAAATLGAAVGIVVLAQAYLSFTHRGQTPASLALPIAAATALLGLLFWAMLRAEELRLARELRTARTGTAALRALVGGRRRAGSALPRLLSTRLGVAAVLLADGDRGGALEVLARGSPLMRGGLLERLGAVVDADVERETGTTAGLEHAVSRLRAMGKVGNREADLYRSHVLAKAVLELGDAEVAEQAAAELSASRDDEERVYLIWLETWFELGAGEVEPTGEPASGAGVAQGGVRAPSRSPSEGELRMAALLARAHGAAKLVERLEARVAAIAASAPRK